MKNVSLGLNIVLIIAVVVLYVLHFNSKPNVEQKTKKTTNQVVKDIPKGAIAFVNSDSLFRNYAFFNETRELIQEEGKKAEARLYNEQANFQKKVAQFQNQVAKHLITSTNQKKMERDLGLEQQRLQAMAQTMQMEMVEREQKMQKDLQDSIFSYIKSYNEEFNYTYILSTSGSILYGNENLDITDFIIKGLNSRYKGTDVEVKEEESK